MYVQKTRTLLKYNLNTIIIPKKNWDQLFSHLVSSTYFSISKCLVFSFSFFYSYLSQDPHKVFDSLLFGTWKCFRVVLYMSSPNLEWSVSLRSPNSIEQEMVNRIQALGVHFAAGLIAAINFFCDPLTYCKEQCLHFFFLLPFLESLEIDHCRLLLGVVWAVWLVGLYFFCFLLWIVSIAMPSSSLILLCSSLCAIYPIQYFFHISRCAFYLRSSILGLLFYTFCVSTETLAGVAHSSLEHRPSTPRLQVWSLVRAHTRVNRWLHKCGTTNECFSLSKINTFFKII